jgi:hypothetical protein
VSKVLVDNSYGRWHSSLWSSQAEGGAYDPVGLAALLFADETYQDFS